ncbi:MAG: hypothetical protein HY075_08485 [Deltaproteobacteria bacterium]|nr:hypothetical protein [Deltaproteobacteria bacterium]
MQLATRKCLKLITATTFALLIAAPFAQASKFANQFVEFELPNNWKCGLEGAEWVCQSLDENKKRDAIIVLAAKLKGDKDTLEEYQKYLEKPRTFTGAGGKAISSQPKYAQNKTLNGQLWVDSLHLESEIPGFFTRYLATIKEDIGVLVTYSVNKTKFQDYQKQFDDMISSLKVFRKKGGLNTSNASLFDKNTAGIAGSGIFNANVDPNAGGVNTAAGGPKKTSEGGGGAMGLILLLAAGGGGFIYWKKKKAAGG